MSKVAIVGSRDYPRLEEVRRYVRTLPRDSTIITGGALGVDSAAESEAKAIRLSRIILEPIVMQAGSKEAYIRALLKRNERIAEACDYLVAFWDGSSTGTRHVVTYTRKLGKVAIIYEVGDIANKQA